MLKELYYWMYYHLLKVKTNDMPEFNAYILICILLYFNVATIMIIACYILGINLKTEKNTGVYLGLFLGLSILVTNYFILYSKRTFIFEKFKAIPKERRHKRLIYFWIYVIFSFSALFIAGVNLTK